MSSADTPEHGSRLTPAQAMEIASVIEARQRKFDEPMSMSVGVALFNAGDRWRHVWCVDPICAWEGPKADAVASLSGMPVCPHGHPLVQGNSLDLGWMCGNG